MTPREAFGVVDGAIARATNLPVSYVAINEALKTLQAALGRLDKFEAVRKCDVYGNNVDPEKAETKDL